MFLLVIFVCFTSLTFWWPILLLVIILTRHQALTFAVECIDQAPVEQAVKGIIFILCVSVGSLYSWFFNFKKPDLNLFWREKVFVWQLCSSSVRSRSLVRILCGSPTFLDPWWIWSVAVVQIWKQLHGARIPVWIVSCVGWS